MKCMSRELLAVLPPRLRNSLGPELPEDLCEIRLRLNKRVCLVTETESKYLGTVITGEDLSWVIGAASRHSPWNSATMAKGYLTAPGGHRIGVCGQAVLENGRVSGMKNLRSLCIRVARDFPGLGRGIDLRESTLILGPPGSGKTTLLRDLIRRISRMDRGSISVVDEREELFPQGAFDPGDNTDILTGCSKPDGIDMTLRAMGPAWIAVDEITAQEDCRALIRAGWCGVKLMATAHASGIEDLMSRPVYRPLLQTGLFRSAVVLRRDRHMERVVL